MLYKNELDKIISNRKWSFSLMAIFAGSSTRNSMASTSLLVVLGVVFIIKSVANENLDVCLNKYSGKDINCQANEVILMTSARYGRMRQGSCLSRGPVGCFSDVLRLLDQWCSGLKDCILDEGFSALSNVMTNCTRGLPQYLEVQYQCISVAIPEPTKCSREKNYPATLISTPTGFIASFISYQTDCGYRNARWGILAPQDSVIDLWMVDFGNPSEQKTLCGEYAVIVESDRPDSIVCKAMLGKPFERTSHILESRTNYVEVYLPESYRVDQGLFLIYYEMKPAKHQKLQQGRIDVDSSSVRRKEKQSEVSPVNSDTDPCSLDICLIMDYTASRGSKWPISKLFAASFASLFTISRKDNQIGLVKYKSRGKVAIKLDEYPDKDLLIRAILSQKDGGTSPPKIDGGLKIASRRCFVQGARSGHRNVAILLSDGTNAENRTNTLKKANKLRNKAQVITVGVGNWKENGFLLRAIAGDKQKHFHSMNFYSDIAQVARSIHNMICSDIKH